jgi:uncharacterized membrane protein YeaQ/YmgE (transglycosylase-associated protein family)
MSAVISVISWIIFGGIVGAIARLLVPGQQSMSMVMTIVLGIVGSFVGGAISWLIFRPPTGNINPAGWIMSIVGAIIVVLVYVRLQNPKRA